MIIRSTRNLFLTVPTITALVGDRIYPRQLPDGPNFPAIVLTKIFGRGEQDMAGAVALEEARVQIDAYSDKGYDECLEVTLAIKRFFHGYTGPVPGSSCAIQRAHCINDSDFAESQVERAGPRLRRRLMEFTVWNSEV